MRRLRRLAMFSGVFLLGCLIGPLSWAAIGGLRASSGQADRMAAAYRLLHTFDAQYPHPLVLYSMNIDGTAEDCGHDPARLLGADELLTAGPNWNPYTGYFDLIMWLGDEFSDAVQDRRVAELGSRFSTFELTFLERCIRATAFAGLCSSSVETLLDGSRLLHRDSLPDGRPDQRRRHQTICAYLDGIAARRSLPLAPRAELPSPGM